MSKMAWDNAWNTGQPVIDQQHQTFLGIINKLEDAFLQEQGLNQAHLQQAIFKELLAYTRYHFSSEEALMREAGYPEVACHWRLHKAFDQTVYEKQRSLENGECLLTSELISLTRDWLIGHIQQEDQKFAQFLRKQQTS